MVKHGGPRPYMLERDGSAASDYLTIETAEQWVADWFKANLKTAMAA